ncbi:MULTISPECIES: ankyrin repeat domain-containing protein [Legionella]|uniref:Ankyrin repeat protein n=1 Tax=Legionella drozanskii LLAP-1 TaxID=1212489 RepID=A0A0W0TE44_9GAMM|nr:MULTISPECIES: ankyrin repeat domain-containing protein [Legionella]KTC93842.1 ankyrin repeat protein [Legionella drozanskii LLAP-1]
MSLKEIREKYEKLREIIAERQLFEGKIENQKPPYITHPTHANFFDINGYTLLHYASMAGDEEAVANLIKDPNVNIEQIPLFQKEGITALEMALEAGHLEIAKILFERGAKCSHILAAKVHPTCRVWFNDQILESLNESYPQLKESNFDKSKSSRFFNSFMASPFDRLAELGDLETIKNGANEFRYSESLLPRLLLIAASNGHQDLVDYLLSKGGELSPNNSSFRQTALHAAAQHHQHQLVQYLLSLGSYINYQNEVKKTPLMLAVEANDLKMVKLLLEHQADVLLKDVYGNCVFHYAIRQNNPEITQLLLEHPQKELLLKSKNIYGFTGVDRAIDAGNEEQLTLIYPKKELEAVRKNPLYGQQRAAINHRYLLPIMHYYLMLNYRDTDYLAITGHCNGFSILRNFYSARGQKSYYYENLRFISKLRRSLSTLNASFPEESEQAKYHESVSSLLEYWTQDIIWFQGTATRSVIPIPQEETERKFELVAPATKEVSIVSVSDMDTKQMTLGQVNEYLSLIRKMPAGIQFNLGGGEHGTSGDVVESGTYVDYHDPNFEFEADPELLAHSLSDLVMDIKYRAIKKITEDNKLPISFYIFYFSNQTEDIALDKFKLFSKQERPKNKETAKKYQENSPCQFTHLHAALITGSSRSLEKLLQEGHCDPTAKDSFGRNIFDIALQNKNAKMISLILQYLPNTFDISEALLSNSTEDNNQISDILIKYAKPEDLIALCVKQIEFSNLAFVESFVKHHKEIINLCSTRGHSLLVSALELKNYSIVEVLIKNGASSLLLGKPKNILDEEPQPISALQYVIDQNLVDYFSVILGDSPQFLGLLKAHSEGNTKQEIELLKEMTFDSPEPMHQSILSILLVSAIKLKNTELFIALTQKANRAILDQLYDGKPLIVQAVAEKNLPMLEALLEQGACVDNQTHPGKNTALHVALKLKLDSEFIKVLIDYHARTDIADREGVVATQLANTAPEDIQQLISPSQYRPTMFK